jgi:two-component system, NtrC family, sensor histidine kinase KinB
MVLALMIRGGIVVMNLKTKLLIAFCGLVLILVIVGVLSVRTVTESSNAMDRIFRDNYDSVAVCYRMKESLHRLDHMAQTSLWQEYPGLRWESQQSINEFENSFRFQQGNVTVPGEQEATHELTQRWAAYLEEYRRFLETDSGSGRSSAYRQELLPRSQEVLVAAQKIIELNLNNMVSVDGQARVRAIETRRTMVLLLLSGIAIAAIFIAVILPAILRPIAGLKRSVAAIREGNLDLVVKVHSRDELGQLAEAVNEMARSLRDYRRSDRSRFLRTQRSTLLALNSLPTAVAICNQSGEIELANEAAQSLFGLKPDASISASGHAVITELFSRACRDLRPVKPKSYADATQVFHHGEEHFFLPEAIPILDERRELVGVTLVLSDVTDIRRLSELKRGLIATVSHELKTPLTSVRLAIHTLLSEKVGPLTLKQSELLEAARNDSDRLHRIIENLLDMSRMESGRAAIEKVPVTSDQLIVEASEEFRTAFFDRGVHLEIELPSDAPSVFVDPVRMHHVFANLLNNALKHTPPGGVVSISAHREGEEVRFVVEDTGPGIPDEYLPHVFEEFFRVPGQDQKSDTGLGLAIVKEIVALHGGTIEVMNLAGKGARFTFALKAAEAGGGRGPSESRIEPVRKENG